ncbi:MAG TPA: hypothetical protein VF364_06800 [Candidatus Limnocylindria bacterium]
MLVGTRLFEALMETLLPIAIAIGLLIALDLAAIRFGTDTRDR